MSKTIPPRDCYVIIEDGKMQGSHVFKSADAAANQIESFRQNGWRGGLLSIRKATLFMGEQVDAYKAGNVLGVDIFVPIS